MAKNKMEIIRTVSLNGEDFPPGDEEELMEAFEAAEENDVDELFSADDEIDRLTRLGFLVGFVELDEDELDGGNSDERVTRESRKATMQEAEAKPRGARKGAAKKKAPKKMAKNRKAPETSTGDADEDTEEANGEE